jgi:hypothetical protein
MISKVGTTGTALPAASYSAATRCAPGDRLLDALLPEDAEGGRAGVAVEGDVELAGQDQLAAGGQLDAGPRRREPRLEPGRVAEGVTQGQHRRRLLRRERGDQLAARPGVGAGQQVHVGTGGACGGDGGEGVRRGRRRQDDQAVLALRRCGLGAVQLGCRTVEGERGDGGERIAVGRRGGVRRVDDLHVVEALRPGGGGADRDDGAGPQSLDLGLDRVVGGRGLRPAPVRGSAAAVRRRRRRRRLPAPGRRCRPPVRPRPRGTARTAPLTPRWRARTRHRRAPAPRSAGPATSSARRSGSPRAPAPARCRRRHRSCRR